MARENGVPEWRLQCDIDFESVVRGHNIYKTEWMREIDERLVCEKEDRKEAAFYDENAIGVHKQIEVDQKARIYSRRAFTYETFFLNAFLF